MKYKKRLKNLQARIEHWDSCSPLREANRTNPGTHKKPGSKKK